MLQHRGLGTRTFLLFLLTWVGAALPGYAQADASDQMMQSYEGQNVSTLEIAGRPDLDTAKYEPLLQLKQGQPFSQQQISATVEALKKTGDFKDVELVLQPETNGVRVMFVAEPAVYVALYDFPGALKVFPYSRLIQVANYRAQEPYSAVDVKNAQVALEKFYHQAGFFEATVQAEVRTNQQFGIVNVLFHSDLKRRAKFGEVKMEGATAEQTAFLEGKLRGVLALLRGAKIKKGKPYYASKIRLATGYLQGRLAKQDHLAADVKFVRADYNPATNLADITFHVESGPRVHVSITGGHIWFWDKKKLLPIYAEGSIDDELIREGQQNLQSYFQSKGFFDAVVQTNVSRNSDNSTLIKYEITKNGKHKVEKVALQGNTSLSNDDLLNHSAVQKAHWFSHGKYSEQLVRQSVNNLKAVYKNAGYSDVKVEPRVTRDNGNVLVTFVVQEGPRDFVSELKVVGNSTVPIAQLAPKGLMLGANRPYSPLLEQQDRNAITAQYLLNGYLTASVATKSQPVSKSDPHHMIVTYTIHEGPKVTTAKLIVVGKQQTREDLILKTTNIRVGAPLSEGELLSSESRLYTLGIFDWAEVDPKRAITDQNSEEVLVKVHEAKRNTIVYGFGFEVINRGGSLPSGTVSVPGIPPVGLPQGFRTSQSTYYGPRGTFEYTRRNLRGSAESYTVGGFAGRLDQRVSATYTDPFFVGSSWSTQYLISGEHDSENPIFTSRIGSAGLQFQKWLDAKKTKEVFFRYNFQYTDLSRLLLPDLVQPADRRVRLSTLSASYVRDTRDSVLDAHKGIYQSFELAINPSVIGSSVNFARAVGQISYYKNIGHKIIWANNLRLGLEEPFNGSRVPISEAFFTGGGATLRGFPLNGAGPQEYLTVCGTPGDTATCGIITVPTGGNQLLLVNSEFRIPLNGLKKGLGIVPFYDGGNVYKHVGFSDFTTNCNSAPVSSVSPLTGNTIETVTPTCFTSSVGIGLRYSTPIGPVRIDIGHNLNGITGIKSTQVFITLGQAF
ncbi:MAG TPA: POTRA domain-containing protein [Candidatus Koribacter sp.]